MPTTVGIDLGTTNSAIAYIDQYGKPLIIPNDIGSTITSSVICFRDDEILIGDEAKELQALGMYPIAVFFKRQMGDENFLFEADGKDYTATDLSTMLLKKLKKDAETYLSQSIKDAVITVPAYFKESERKATIEAGQKAGFNVLQVINEPTAAAAVYGLGNTLENKTILIYDLGGGTFDVTLLKYKKESINVLNSAGDHQLGGKDWDDRIIEYLASEFQQEFGEDPLEDTESVADLLVQAEEAKKKLTSFGHTKISITHDGMKGRYELDRTTFEKLTADLMERTISMTTRVLEDMGLSASDVDGILLVGGSTRMPMVHHFIEEEFGQKPLKGVNVDEAVALGAAIVANEYASENKREKATFSIGGPRKLIDVTNHSLGMIAITEDKSAYTNSIILPKNREIPCEEVKSYKHRTGKNRDNELEIFMTQGELTSPGDVSYLGRYVVRNIPHQQGGVATIDVSYQYDNSGTVQVEAGVEGSSNNLVVEKDILPDDVPDRFLRAPEIEEVEYVPENITVYLAFDISGSMRGHPLEKAKKAAYEFLDKMDFSRTSLGLIIFSDKVRVELKTTQDQNKIKNIIQNIKARGGNQADPFDEILALLEREEGRRYAIVLTDGVWCHQKKAIEKAKKCHQNNIDIIAIGFGGADKRFLRDIASSDKGSIFTTAEGLVETFSTIAQEIVTNQKSDRIKMTKKGYFSNG